jgi:hypothetical protein
MSTPRLPRREFLLRALAACSAPVFSPRLAQLTTNAKGGARSARLATRYLGPSGAAAAKAVGEAYFRALGVKSATDVPLAGTLQLIARAQEDAAAIAALVRAVRTDFRNGRVVDVEGWIISRTEGELCVIVLLAAK